MTDLVNKPPHYRLTNIRSLDGKLFDTDVLNILDAIDHKAVGGVSVEFKSGIKLHYYYSAIAYLFRAPFKGSARADIEKAIFYLNLIIGKDQRNG